jgi:hypothetical protein
LHLQVREDPVYIPAHDGDEFAYRHGVDYAGLERDPPEGEEQEEEDGDVGSPAQGKLRPSGYRALDRGAREKIKIVLQDEGDGHQRAVADEGRCTICCSKRRCVRHAHASVSDR